VRQPPAHHLHPPPLRGALRRPGQLLTRRYAPERGSRALLATCPNGLDAVLPWTDILVQIAAPGGTVRAGALPAQNVDVTLNPFQGTTPTPVVPELPPLWLFASGLLLLAAVSRRSNKSRKQPRGQQDIG
jgi:hypothetical protein